MGMLHMCSVFPRTTNHIHIFGTKCILQAILHCWSQPASQLDPGSSIYHFVWRAGNYCGGLHTADTHCSWWNWYYSCKGFYYHLPGISRERGSYGLANFGLDNADKSIWHFRHGWKCFLPVLGFRRWFWCNYRNFEHELWRQWTCH